MFDDNTAIGAALGKIRVRISGGEPCLGKDCHCVPCLLPKAVPDKAGHPFAAGLPVGGTEPRRCRSPCAETDSRPRMRG